MYIVSWKYPYLTSPEIPLIFKMDPNPVKVPFPYAQGIDKFQESQYVIVYKSLSKMGLFRAANQIFS